MAYVFVFVVAVAVGVGVYVTTVRASRPGAEGFGPSAEGASPESGTYVPVTPVRPDWQSRLTGFLGLVIAVVVGAVALAVTVYAGVETLVRLVSGSIGSD